MASKDPLKSLEEDMLDVGTGVGQSNDEIAAAQHIERLPNVADQTGSPEKTNGASQEAQECDILVVGAGFSGITAIHRFRKLGLKVKCFEGGDDFGGVWYWNRYPGARVDSEAPFYQLNIPEVWLDWDFSQRFPDHTELRQYMAHIDRVLDLRKDTTFNAQVIDSSWDDATGRWTVKTINGHVAYCKYLMLATGLLHRTYTPDMPGLSEYKGTVVHSGAYPQSLDCTGKRVGLIGAGATAVQITQEIGKVAKELAVFLRRPSYCLPMAQRPISHSEQTGLKTYYPALFDSGRNSLTGFPSTAYPKSAVDASEEEREALWERLWARGAFNYMQGNFADMIVNKESNRLVYEFWAKKVRQRLIDPKKQSIMAPEEPPYFFAAKRCPLENGYYEILNQDNVKLVDLNSNSLRHFDEKGMVMDDGQHFNFDVIVLATGFDSFTGSLTNMGLKNKDGKDLQELWKNGVQTYLGLTISGFPNCFMSYSPQAPTALSNGTTIIEAQVETIADMIAKAEKEGLRSLEARHEAEVEWKSALDAMTSQTLLPYTSSWWNGANIPGKKAEGMTYVAGIQAYEKQCRDTMDGWKGFDVVAAT